MTDRASHARPARIDQIIPTIVEHDAVSNHTFAVRDELRALGFDSEIYAEHIGPGCEGRVAPLSALERRAVGQWVIYQASIGAPAAEVFAAHPGTKLLDYHNIVPAELVERFLPPLGVEARLGRRQLAELAPKVAYAFADSAFNAAELTALGYPHARVVPVLVEPANLTASPDPGTLEQLGSARRAGGGDWLFVGQIAPHKGQHRLVAALSCYRELYDPEARLHLVGREMGNTYRDAVARFVRALGLDHAVELTGAVPSGVLAAHYATADVFVCLSAHEGYCVPVIEAMARGIPVVVADAGALPETVADAGIVLEGTGPLEVATAVHELLADSAARAVLSDASRARASEHSLEHARHELGAAIAEAIELFA